MDYDIAIIGAGVIGCLTARELSKYDLKIVLIEKCNDVAMGASKSNSGIVHAGFDAMPGTLKAKMNVIGTSLMEETCKTLSVPYKNNGSLVVAFSEEQKETLNELFERGIKNGVKQLRIIDKDELKKLEPNISDEAVGALYAPTAGIVSPYELTIAAAECAVSNGVDFIRNFAVKKIDISDDIFTIESEDDENIKAKYIINAAGIFSDNIAAMIGDNSFNITARLGEYGLLDKSAGGLVSHTIFQCPTKFGKGVLVTPSVHGNILVGPTAVDIKDKTENAISQKGLSNVFNSAKKSVPSLNQREMITSFSGLRAHDQTDDFTIAPSKVNNKFINVAGIESPGLASSPAIAKYVEEVFIKVYGKEPEKINNYNPSRKAPVRFNELSKEEQRELINKDKSYGRIICRCETVTEGEIIDAIKAPAGARDVDAVKRRTRAGMGRCQGGFCGSKVMEILARELNVPINEITKFGGKSDILYERTK